MAIICDNLSAGMKPRIYSTFVEAFSDYAMDMRYMTEEIVFNRAEKNGVDFDLSVGAFDGERLVGYTLVGVDKWKGSTAVFDITTGIIKPYRGKGIARAMFDRALPGIKKRGAEIFVLEVLRENAPAVKAYTKTGFHVTREFDCYHADVGELSDACGSNDEIEVAPAGKDLLARFEEALDRRPSWENSFPSIRRIPDDVLILAADAGKGPAGLLVYYPAINWVMTIAVMKEYRRAGVGTALLAHLAGLIGGTVKRVKIMNVDRSDDGLSAFLISLGFEVLVSQYEMEMDL